MSEIVLTELYEELIEEHLRENPQMLFLMGPRQVGKTTSAKAVGERYPSHYFNWDYLNQREILQGGMLIASRPLSELVPLEPASMDRRVVCQWDKNMVEDAGLIKVDILSLGMLAVLRDTGVDLSELTYDDPAVYEMISRADTIGLFQVESRAQMQSLPRTRPTNLPELAIQVALIRPGPLQGKMVQPYIRRRRGREKVVYPHPCLATVLEETLGVILFQEQVLQVAVVMAGFTQGQAAALRRAMPRMMQGMRTAFIDGAAERGVPVKRAADTFELLCGFASYGFCKSHALSFDPDCYPLLPL